MKKGSMLRARMLVLLMLSCCFMTLTGFDLLGHNSIKIDVDSNPVYESYQLEDILNSKDALAHNLHDIVTEGVITQVAGNSRSVSISTSASGNKFVSVIGDKKFIKGLSVGDSVIVYGKYKDKTQNTIAYIEADLISKNTNNKKLSSDYYFPDGRMYMASEGIETSIANGKIQYKIPKEWKKVETTEFLNVRDGEGYCYNLNRLKGVPQAECFCIFYFDKARHIQYESSMDDDKAIEEAIISSISSHGKGFMNTLREIADKDIYNKNVNSSYGKKYHFYAMNYKNHHLEYAFTPTKGGLCVMLYMYSEDYSSAEDIIYMMRTLKTSI